MKTIKRAQLSKKEKLQLLMKIERHTKNIAKERDALNELRNEVWSVEESADEAIGLLHEAIRTLSQYL